MSLQSNLHWALSSLGRGVIPSKALGCTLFAGFLAAGLPCAAQADAISFNYKAQTLFGIPTSGASNVAQVYDTVNGWGATFLEPAVPVNPLYYSTSAGEGTLYYNYFNTLNRMYPTTSGWGVTGKATALAPGSLQINTYGAIGTPARVGADFALTYLTTMPGPNNTIVPNGNPTANLHWIQVVSTNNAITYPGGMATSNPGTLANKVDVRRTNTTSPYYDQGFAANSTNFVDKPGRPDVEFENDWIASLFLASGPANPGTGQNPAQITVYNDSGILWGWQNFFFPNVNEQQFVQDVEQDVFADDQLGDFYVDLDLGNGPAPVNVDMVPPADYGVYEQAFSASVPEPATWLLVITALVVLAAYCPRQKTSVAGA